MKTVEINLLPETCDDLAHAERVIERVKRELPPLLPDGYAIDAEISRRGGRRRLDPVWLPDTDPNDPEYDAVASLAYDTMSRIRDEEEAV